MMNKSHFTRIVTLGLAALLLLAVRPATADDTEIFTGAPNAVSAVRPNILFIFDTSGSMGSTITTQVPYDPATAYSGTCDPNYVYFRTGSNGSTPPDCTSGGWWRRGASSIPASAFKCAAGASALASAGFYIADRAAQWQPATTGWRPSPAIWTILTDLDSQPVECKADAGIDGDGLDATKLWAADGSNGPWTSNPAQAISWNQNGIGSYTFFSANYLNWYNHGARITQTRLQIVQQVANQTLRQLAASNNVNVGLMRYSSNTVFGCNDAAAEGGMVMTAMGPVGTNAGPMETAITNFNASGCTPLSETFYEAFLYLSGGNVRYGLNSYCSPPGWGSPGVSCPSVAESREPAPNQNTYKSPLVDSCQRNFIVLLTDGLPTADQSANADIQALIGRPCAGSGDGKCLTDIARYMYEHDLRPNTPGMQNVTTYTIGFGPDVATGTALLQNTAAGAGGVYYTAGDTAQLTVVLTDIIRNILNVNTSFTAPAVSVNAFNRTQNLNDLYVTVFKPATTYDWPGNVKKYHLAANGTIMDANGYPAVDVSTGFFRSTSQSYWSLPVDGDNVKLGGAANMLPLPTSRKVYSNLSTNANLTAAANDMDISNATITAATLGLAATAPPGRDNLILWMRGTDIDDANGNGLTTDARHEMGDPMHGRPATMIYGGTATTPDPQDGVLYAVTNAGYLHAVNVKDGTELWTFIPRDMLARASAMYQNAATNPRSYGLDGNVRLYKYDANGNGIIEPSLGDRVLLFFGMRRGGRDYYALDVTDRNSPILLWKDGPLEAGTHLLPGAGQTWSTPTLAQVTVAGQTQNAQHLVLVMGGGYDTVQDNGPYAVDSIGNYIYMVDAYSGDLLWYAGPSTSSADLKLASMTHSIPADVRVIDVTGDGVADRMYAADMGGRVWRFDIASGQPRSSLVTGGVFASLGNADQTTHPASSNRRFYNGPDVAYLQQGGRVWLNLALGSGYRAHPLDLGTQDRFYSLRDYKPFLRLTQAQYDTSTPITEADAGLVDITSTLSPTLPNGAEGWRLDLRQSATWTGEKSLAEARTFQNTIEFPTYEPNHLSTPSSTSCSPALGTNRLYAVSAFTGAPVLNRDNPAVPPNSTTDRAVTLAQGGIAPEVVWLFPSPDNPSCTGAACRPPPVCLVGLESCGIGLSLAPVRTFWRQAGAQ